MHSYGTPHMAEQKQGNQLEHTYSSYVRIRGVALKTCLRRWTIGKSGERGSGISVLAARHDDDDFNINSHDPYNIKKGIVRCLQLRVKAITGDSDSYQEEIKSLRDNLHYNIYPESITSAPRNLDRTTENITRKLTTVCLPYVKGLAEKIQKICNSYDIKTIFRSGSILRNIFLGQSLKRIHDQELCIFHPM